MINIEFLVVTYFISLFVDWIFQWSWQANNKSKWAKNDNKRLSFVALISHSFIYAFITTVASLWLINDYSNIYVVFLTLFISHVVIDTRIPVIYILRFKGHSWSQINDYNKYGFMHIGIDHRLHEITLLVLSCIV